MKRQPSADRYRRNHGPTVGDTIAYHGTGFSRGGGRNGALLLLLSLGTAVVGCGEEAQQEEEVQEDLEQVAAEALLGSEAYNGSAAIVYAANQYYTNPDMAVSQWAEASFHGNYYCNGVMIGPNIYFTASHCGAPANVQILFRTYRNGSTASSDTEAFTCNQLIQTYNDTDGSLFYCAPNAVGQNPGDKYGYVDFDVSTPTVGQQVYSISANPTENGSVPWDARMYVTGQVASTSDNNWHVPNADPNTGMNMNLWGELGMSGSPHFNAANHKMIIAPLSVGPGGSGGWWRLALSMRSLLYWGFVNPNYNPNAQGPTVNTAFVQSLGLNPSSYYGWADEELDWEFDIQRDLERLRGEARRGWYSLGFESQRRNALWDPVSGMTSFDVNNRWARILRSSGSGFTDALSHRKLNLQAGTYRLTVMTYTSSAAYSSSLWVGFKSGGSYVSGQYVPNTVGSGWQMHTLYITAPSDNAELTFGAYGTADILLSAVSLVKQGDVMDFDTFDKRTNWRNDITGGRALVVPDGRTTGTPNWAVVLRAPATSGYPVRNRQLALDANRSYRICFDARRPSSTGSAQAELRVVSGGTVATSTQRYVGTSWANYCTSTFVPPSDDNNLQIRLMSGDAAFYVDNITITEM